MTIYKFVFLARRARSERPQMCLNGRPRLETLAPFLLALVIAGLFAYGVSRQSTSQNTVDAADQDANSYYVVHLWSGGTIQDRNRMPLFPYIVYLVTEPTTPRQQIYEMGKRVGVVVAVLSLLGLGAGMKRRFGTLASLTSVAIAALTVYQFKAPYMQADLLYYGLLTATFFLMIRAIRQPTPLLGAGVGIMAGLAQLAKAGALVMLVLFLLTTAVTSISRWRHDRHAAVSLVTVGATALFLFAAVFAPYASNSKATYGSYLHNVNTRYYAWYDSWDDALKGTVSHGDNLGRPDLPADQIPSPQRYLRTHGARQIAHRLVAGASRTLDVARHAYGYLFFVILELLVVAVLVAVQPRRVIRWTRRNQAALGFGAATLVAYALTAIWWVPLSDGPRFSLTMFLPLLVLLTGAIARLGRRLAVSVHGHEVRFDTITLSVILTAALIYGGWASFVLAPNLYGGT